MATGYIDFKVPVLQRGYHYVTSDFGPRTLRGKPDNHKGIDIVGKPPDKKVDNIIAYADGVVTSVGDNHRSMGTYVQIYHGDNIYTRYLHMKSGSRVVNKGDKVKRGQKIGYMGTTGDSTGIHLHFDINLNGNYVDPKPYLKGEIGPSSDPTNVAPTISNITQDTSTIITITGKSNLNPSQDNKVQIYYKWDGNVSIEGSTNYDDFVITNKHDFNLSITKPRSAKYISLIPVNINSENETTIGEVTNKELYESYPCIYIQTDGGVKESIPYINTGNGKWELATPTIKNKGYWYELYNTDSERVK